MALYHYTPAYRASAILDDGFLRPLGCGLKAGEVPYLWFSSNPNLELTVTRPGPTTLAALGVDRCRTVRFVYTGTAIPYGLLKLRLARRRNLEREARALGALPHEWFGIPGAVSVRDVLLQDRVQGHWRNLPAQHLAAEFADITLVLLPDGRIAFDGMTRCGAGGAR